MFIANGWVWILMNDIKMLNGKIYNPGIIRWNFIEIYRIILGNLYIPGKMKLYRCKIIVVKISKKIYCTGVYQLLFWINFWGCPGNLKITVTPPWPRFESYHGIFFPYTFFIHFIKFSSAVEMSSPIKFFL